MPVVRPALRADTRPGPPPALLPTLAPSASLRGPSPGQRSSPAIRPDPDVGRPYGRDPGPPVPDRSRHGRRRPRPGAGRFRLRDEGSAVASLSGLRRGAYRLRRAHRPRRGEVTPHHRGDSVTVTLSAPRTGLRWHGGTGAFDGIQPPGSRSVDSTGRPGTDLSWVAAWVGSMADDRIGDRVGTRRLHNPVGPETGTRTECPVRVRPRPLAFAPLDRDRTMPLLMRIICNIRTTRPLLPGRDGAR